MIESTGTGYCYLSVLLVSQFACGALLAQCLELDSPKFDFYKLYSICLPNVSTADTVTDHYWTGLAAVGRKNQLLQSRRYFFFVAPHATLSGETRLSF